MILTLYFENFLTETQEMVQNGSLQKKFLWFCITKLQIKKLSLVEFFLFCMTYQPKTSTSVHGIKTQKLDQTQGKKGNKVGQTYFLHIGL